MCCENLNTERPGTNRNDMKQQPETTPRKQKAIELVGDR